MTHNRTYDLGAVTGADESDAGVPHGRELIAFADAVLGDKERALADARAALATALGRAGLADAAGIVGLFNAIDRVADATGIPLEAEKLAASADFRAMLALDRFAVASRA